MMNAMLFNNDNHPNRPSDVWGFCGHTFISVTNSFPFSVVTGDEDLYFVRSLTGYILGLQGRGGVDWLAS